MDIKDFETLIELAKVGASIGDNRRVPYFIEVIQRAEVELCAMATPSKEIIE